MLLTKPPIIMARRALDPHGLTNRNNADYCEKHKNLVTQPNTKLIKAKLQGLDGDMQFRLAKCTVRCNCYAVHVPDERTRFRRCQAIADE